MSLSDLIKKIQNSYCFWGSKITQFVKNSAISGKRRPVVKKDSCGDLGIFRDCPWFSLQNFARITILGCHHNYVVFCKFRNDDVCIPYQTRNTRNFCVLTCPVLRPRNGMWTQRLRTQKLRTKDSCSNLSSFTPEKQHADLKKHCFWDGMNLGRWACVGFLWS